MSASLNFFTASRQRLPRARRRPRTGMHTATRLTSVAGSPLMAEPLERRALLAVTAVINGGDLEIAYNVAGDLAAEISSDGTNYTVSGTGLAATQFPIGAGGVTGRIVVTDNASLAGQAFTVNAGTALANPLQVNADVEATTLTGGITTTVAGDVLIGSPAILLANDISTAATNSKVTLSGAVALAANVAISGGSGAVTLESTVNGGHGLTVNSTGNTTFSGTVGGVTPLASLQTDAGGETIVVDGRTVRTSGDQTYGDPFRAVDTAALPRTIVLEAATLRASSSFSVFGQSIRIDGNAVFGSHPGSPLPDPSSLPIDPVIVGSPLDEIGRDLTVTGTVIVNSNRFTATGFAAFEQAVTLGSDLRMQLEGGVFSSTISGPGRTLFVAATKPSAIVFDGDVGTAAAPLGPVTVFSVIANIVINAPMHSADSVVLQTLAQIATPTGGFIGGNAANEIHAPEVALIAFGDIGGPAPIAVEAGRVSAFSFDGDIQLRGIGDIVVGDLGLDAGGAIDLEASGRIIVPAGPRQVRIIADDGVTADQRIRWEISETTGSGAGSLGDALAKANVAGAPGIIEIGGGTLVYTLDRQLPPITTDLIIDGGGTVTVAGNGSVANGFSFAAGSAGSELRGIAVRGFRNFGIRLDNAAGVTVSDMTVTSLNTRDSMGLYATGNLAGTTIESSLFTGGLRGALLVNARNLAFGAIGRGNTFVNNRPVPGSQYSGTGIRAQGNLAGTVVAGNTFNWNNYGFAFINARNLRLENNLFTRNRIAAIFVEGNNTGSSMAGNTFGQGAQRNASIFRRIPGARGI